VSILTLNKFLLSSQRASEGAVPETPSGDYLDLASRTIAAVRRSIFVGETFVDLFDEIDVIRKDLHVESGHEAISQCSTRVEDVLARYQKRLRQADEERAADFKKVLDILNEVLGYITSDNEKSEERRKQLESNLSVAARVDDITALRSHLAKILHAVRDEGRNEKSKAQEVIDGLGKQIQQVHKAQSRFISHLPGRNNAIEYLKPFLQTVPPLASLRMAMFAADSLRVIRERHGEEAANSIIQDLAAKQVQPLFPEGKVFCWSPNALLLVWHSQDESTAPGDILSRLKPSYEQRAFVGTRVAVFNVTLRSLVVQVRGTMEELAWTLDRFSRGGGAC
jgi:hypothetical protein